MRRINKNLFKIVPTLLLAGSLGVGSLVWASNTHLLSALPAHKAGLKLSVDEQPLQRHATISASFADVIKKVAPSVVKVSTVMKAKLASSEAFPQESIPPFLHRFFGDQFQWNTPNQPMPMPPQHGVGSGVIVTKDGYILTNNHVVDKADEVKVTLNDKREFTAKVVGRDPLGDIALIKVDAQNLPAIELADSDKIAVGDIVLAIGNPFGIGQTVTMGIVSATGRGGMGIEDYEDFIQTDAAINPGNSGGALVDAEGRLIGINTAILSRSGGNQGVGFAIPVNFARHEMNSLVKYGHVVRGFLGVSIQDITPDLAKEFKLNNTQGALIANVSADSPASKAGLKDGDVMVEFNGKPVTDSRHLKLQVAETSQGQTVPVKVVRNGETRTLQVKIGELPGDQGVIKTGHSADHDTGTLNGVAVADLDAQDRQQFKVPANLHGALITNVDPNSAAAEAGLLSGDVILEINHQSVQNAEDAVRLTEHPKTKVTLLRVWSHGGAHYVVVDESKAKGA